MNQIILKGIIKDIEPSHIIEDIQYSQAKLLVKRDDNKEDIIDLKFKKFACKYDENNEISLVGNLRTFSQQLENKNKVHLYVYTYFDEPQGDLLENLPNNIVDLDGFICKKSIIRKTRSGKDIIDFVIVNNLQASNKVINCYIPAVTWGKNAKFIDNLPIGSKITVQGRLQSREYKKYISETDYEIRIAHELSVKNILVHEMEE